MRRQALVVRGGSQPLRLVEHAPGLGQPAAFDQRGAQLGEQRDPPRIVGGKQPGNPLEQADRRGQVAADKRPPSRRLEPLGRPGGERGGARVARSERDAVLEGLLEVVADDLLELAQPVRGRQLEPGGEALVQVGARVLRQRAIGGVADQDVTEAVGLLAGEVRRAPGGSDPGGRAPASRPRAPVERGAGELARRRPGETPRPRPPRSSGSRARSAGRPSRRAARSALIVEGTGSSERSDAATQRSPSRVSSSSSTSIATSSSAKSAIALGRAGDPRLGSGRERRAVEQVGDQLAAFRLAERLEDDRRRVGLAGRPSRGACRAAPAARCRRAGSGNRARSRRRARSGRGTSTRPSGGRPPR